MTAFSLWMIINLNLSCRVLKNQASRFAGARTRRIYARLYSCVCVRTTRTYARVYACLYMHGSFQPMLSESSGCGSPTWCRQWWTLIGWAWSSQAPSCRWPGCCLWRCGTHPCSIHRCTSAAVSRYSAGWCTDARRSRRRLPGWSRSVDTTSWRR